MICGLCWNPVNDNDDPQSSNSVDLEQSFEELQLSAREHCVFCAFRLGIINHSDVERIQEFENVRLSVSFFDLGDGLPYLIFSYEYMIGGSLHRVEA